MKIDYETRKVYLDSITINGPIMVKEILLAFGSISMPFIFVNDGDSVFLYEDSYKYNELIKNLAGNPNDVGKMLHKYEKQFGIEHDLWKQLVTVTIQKYGFNMWEYARQCNVDGLSEYWSEVYNSRAFVPYQIENKAETYKLLLSVLPENIETTRLLQKKSQAEIIINNFKNICGDDFGQKELYLSKLETDNGDNIEKWNNSIQELTGLRRNILQLSEEKLVDSSIAHTVDEILQESLKQAIGRKEALIKSELIKQFGPISNLKKALRESINRLGFTELLDLFKEYKNQENYLRSKARQAGLGVDDVAYREYIDVYRLGSVLISDKMNKINRNKAKNKHIPQELLDEAMIFYYEAKNAQDAYSVQSNEKYSQNKESGDKGEQKVEYALKWLDASFVKIAKKSNDRVGDECIFICNPEFIDEKQEYDHLLVSNKGVFNIETKNYAGKLVIDQYGNWIRKKAGEEEGIKNPLQQIRQHEKILQSFLPKECKVVSIICVANDKAIIEGAENCPIPIVKSDMLVEYLENYNSNDSDMTDSQKEQCIETIYKYMV